ncbi:hypothetical protein, conserved [Eimeria acervulina]|uniref:Uncharacterized protein n=1 Tax=Eimeria acervulina TaxID=5801 RepID=U6GK73_EIMAC|nr:hypothetical protein, conserved [Eimeria acervulina]CDI79683.1 hypothetical protein, conserved [Eimeria acervulina]
MMHAKKGLVPPAASRRQLYSTWGVEAPLRAAIAKDIPMAELFEELVALGAPPARSAAFLVSGLQTALRGVSPLGPISAEALAPALRAADRGTLTNRALRLYAAALSRGDPDAKRLLTDDRSQEEMETRAAEDLRQLLKQQRKQQPGALVGALLSIHPKLCPLNARRLVEEALSSQQQHTAASSS